jgi:hypothetical protein
VQQGFLLVEPMAPDIPMVLVTLGLLLFVLSILNPSWAQKNSGKSGALMSANSSFGCSLSEDARLVSVCGDTGWVIMDPVRYALRTLNRWTISCAMRIQPRAVVQATEMLRLAILGTEF